jgi:hypothetical protein
MAGSRDEKAVMARFDPHEAIHLAVFGCKWAIRTRSLNPYLVAYMDDFFCTDFVQLLVFG